MLTFALKKKRTPSIVPKRHAPTVSPMSHSLHLQQAKVRRILRGPTFQPKLTIGQPNDKYEQEADRVADEVMRMPEPGVQRQVEPEEEEEEMLQAKPLSDLITPLVQRQVEEEEEEEEEPIQTKLIDDTPVQRQEEEEPIMTKGISGSAYKIRNDLSARLNLSRSGGQPLPETDRSFMERRFGVNFSSVRVHTDSNAAQISREINAQAFTHGRDIHFGAGRYSPGTLQGKRLLAHELTHVVQQASGITGLEIFRKDGETKATEVDKRREAAWNMFVLELKDDYPDRILAESIGNLRFAFVALIRELISLVQKEEQAELSTNALENSIVTIIPHVGSMLAAVLTEFKNRLSSQGWEAIEQWIDSIEDAEPLSFFPEELVTKRKTQFLGDPRLKAFFEKQYASFEWSKDVTDFYSAFAKITEFVILIKDHSDLKEIYASHIIPKKNWKQKLSDSIGAIIRENVYLTRVEKERPLLEEEFTLPPKLTPKIIKEKLDQALRVQQKEIMFGGGLSQVIFGHECKYIEGAVKAVYNHIIAQVSPSVWRLEENLKAGKLNLAPYDLPWEALDNYKAFDGACVHMHFGLKERGIPRVSQDTIDRVISDHMEAVGRYFAIRELIRTWYERRREQDLREYKKCLLDFPSGHPWRSQCSKHHLTSILWGEWRNKAITHGVFR